MPAHRLTIATPPNFEGGKMRSAALGWHPSQLQMRKETRMEYIDVCALADLPPGKSRAVRAADRDIALFNVAGNVHALENSCPHQGAALSNGEMCGRIVKCRAHGWRFDVADGALVVAPTLRVPVFQTRIADGRVAVAVDHE